MNAKTETLHFFQAEIPESFREEKKLKSLVYLLLSDSIEGKLTYLKAIHPDWNLPDHVQEHHLFFKMKRKGLSIKPLEYLESIQKETDIVFILETKEDIFRIVYANNVSFHISETFNGNPREIISVEATESSNTFIVTTDVGKFLI